MAYTDPMKILAVDPGEVRIGLAVSDPTGTLARPLQIILHDARDTDAERIAAIAREQGAEMVVVGYSLNEHGRPTRTGRMAAQMATALRGTTGLEVELVEESFTTQDVRLARIEGGMKKKKRRTPPDAEAAARILQSYLDEQKR
ncbi:MAG: Holliday junction resolvase RuvX [Anaerolineales bacterium]